MKSFVVHAPGGLERLEMVERPDPGRPGPNEIRVAIHATSLNFHDLLVANGGIPAAEGRILMSDGAGVVEAVGPDVIEFQPGDQVVSRFFPQWLAGPPFEEVTNFAGTPGDGIDGMASSHVVRAAAAFTRAPLAWSFPEAATITTAGLTAWRALFVDGGLKAGETVLTMGTGGVSLAALQIAKLVGATVVATSSSGEKLERLRALGADHVINYREVENWGAEARKYTGGSGVDHVVEIGGPGTLPQSIEAVRAGGHIALVGVSTGMEGQVPTFELTRRQVRLQGLVVGSRQHQRDYVAAANVSGFRPVIDRTYSFEQLPEAFGYMASGKHFGKICVEW